MRLVSCVRVVTCVLDFLFRPTPGPWQARRCPRPAKASRPLEPPRGPAPPRPASAWSSQCCDRLMVEAHAQQSGPRPHASSPHSPRTQALSHGLHTVGRASPRTTRSGGPAQAGRAANVRREARSRVPKSSSERHAIARRGRPSREKVSLISKCMHGVHACSHEQDAPTRTRSNTRPAAHVTLRLRAPA